MNKIKNLKEAAERIKEAVKNGENIIIYGGADKMRGFSYYLKNIILVDIVTGNPFSKIFYNEKLKSTIEETGHEFTIAVGLALKALQ